jgi:hypothetical protein
LQELNAYYNFRNSEIIILNQAAQSWKT